jgi:hypothetical protein
MSQTLLKNELETLKQYKKDSQWFRTHYAQFKTKYKDKYIAIHKGRVLDKDEDYRKLIRRLRKGNRDTTRFVIKLVRDRPMSFMV